MASWTSCAVIATPATTSAGALLSASTRRREASTAATQPTRANVSQPMARGWRLPCETCTAWPRAAAETAKATAETAESSASEVTRARQARHDAATLPFLAPDYGRLNASDLEEQRRPSSASTTG